MLRRTKKLKVGEFIRCSGTVDKSTTKIVKTI